MIKGYRVSGIIGYYLGVIIYLNGFVIGCIEEILDVRKIIYVGSRIIDLFSSN